MYTGDILTGQAYHYEAINQPPESCSMLIPHSIKANDISAGLRDEDVRSCVVQHRLNFPPPVKVCSYDSSARV